jgi:hypothetical protein
MDEITKHTLKIYKTIRKPETSISKKIVDITLEVLIIVFAVSLAQYLERYREDGIKQKEVKEFLTGLKEDMRADVEQAKGNVQSYNNYKRIYSYLSHLDPNKKPNADSLNKRIDIVVSNTFLRPSVSRFEGFKSSGKLQDIGDKKLLQDILYFYEQAMPQLQSSESAWISMQGKLWELFLEQQVVKPDGTNNNFEIISQPKVHNLCRMLVPWPQIYERYKQVMDIGDTIIKEIDKDYSDS